MTQRSGCLQADCMVLIVSPDELDAMIADAVGGYFEPGGKPQRVRVHFTEDPVVAVV